MQKVYAQMEKTAVYDELEREILIILRRVRQAKERSQMATTQAEHGLMAAA